VSLAASIAMGVRSCRTLALLQSAQAAGVAKTSSLRPWMTLGYVASAYGVDATALRDRLQLPPDTDSRASLKTLAEQHRAPVLEYLGRVQGAIAEASDRQRDDDAASEARGWMGETGDRLLAAVVAYGYPALALTLFIGAVGLPVPTGIATIVAGSLASQGHLGWLTAIALAVGASILGDLAGYWLGRLGNKSFFERRGRWLGYTPASRVRAEALFLRWGALTVLLSRTLVSHLSSVVSILAGLTRYRLAAFVAVAALGRMLWTAAYFGVGYSVGSDLEAASGFLGSLSALLIAVSIAAGTSILLYRAHTAAA
jgi:membrane-associated protein